MRRETCPFVQVGSALLYSRYGGSVRAKHERTTTTTTGRAGQPVSLGGENALLESFSAIADALTSGGDLSTVLQCIAEESLHLLDATSARVRMPDASGTQLVIAALADDEESEIRLPPPDTIIDLSSSELAVEAFRTNRDLRRRAVPRAAVSRRINTPITAPSR